MKEKPRLRAAGARDGLNRFVLAAAMSTEAENPAVFLQFNRLLAISSAQLAAVRRSAGGLTFKHEEEGGWRLHWQAAFGASVVEFPIDQTEVCRLLKLLRTAVHLDLDFFPWFTREEWTDVVEQKEFVSRLTVNRFPDLRVLREFVADLAPNLREFECFSNVLEHLPPLTLQKLVVHDRSEFDYKLLNCHQVKRLDVSMVEVLREFPEDQVLSASLKSLGHLFVGGSFDFPIDSIGAFCRRFPSLENVHVSIHSWTVRHDLDAHFEEEWARCLELRDRLDALTIKRLSFTVKLQWKFDSKHDREWAQKLKRVAPFDKASFWRDPVSRHERMFLKVSRPQDSTPTFFRIEGDFSP
ncbi:hypothetical protein M3Y99_00518000 [Aphelenchoides fujianensis]|nr:hypothetical protein M3Y99_00518000 [Aphelenchoides fujianensis]